MASLSALFGNKSFNPATVEAMDFSPIPKGDYPITITESEIKPTINGKGTLLTLKLVITGGKHNGRILFDNLCVQHSNEIAQRIAQTRLKQICDAVVIKSLTDSSQFHNKALRASIDLEIDDYQTNKRDDGEKVYRNTIKGYGSATPQAETVAPDDYEDDIPF